MPERVSPELNQDISRALEHERNQVVASGAAVRCIGSLAILAVIGIAWQATGQESWRVYLAPLALYAISASLIFALRQTPFVRGAGGMIVLLDVTVVAGVQIRTLPLSPFPAGVAGFSLGLFALLVVLNAVTFSAPVIYLAAAASSIAQCIIMSRAGIDQASMIVATAVLILEARVLHALSTRFQTILRGLASTEVERRFEHRKVAEIEDSKRTIETMLGESHRQNELLRQLQQDKDRLTQLLVHDLRSPLTVITGTVDLVEMRRESPEISGSAEQDLETIRSTALRLGGMISDILGIAKMEDGKLELRRERLEVSPLIAELAEQTRRANAAHRLIIEAECLGSPVLDADVGLVRRVLENLLSNAARYTPIGGRIRLSATSEQGHAIIRLQNEGLPIDPELRQRLFEKYQQAQSTRGGFGLGLYFCRLALEAHGGGIAIEDASGWATSFALRIPLAP